MLALVVLGSVTAWVAAGPRRGFRRRSIVALIIENGRLLRVGRLSWVCRFTPAWFRRAARLRTGGALLALGLCFCFFLSWAANAVGLASLVGACTAGLVLEDTHSEAFVQRGERPLGDLLEPMTAFLVPVFLVLVGFRTNIAALASRPVLVFAVALSAGAKVGELSCV